MAQINSFYGSPLFDPDDVLIDAVRGITPTATATDLTYRNADNGNSVVFHGNFTLDGGGNVTSGTVSGFDVSAGATLLASGSGYGLSATALVAAIVALPPFNFAPLLQLIYSNITSIGSADNDSLFAYSGALFGRGGDDNLFQLDGATTGFIVMHGGKGDDLLRAGDGPNESELFGGMGNDDIFGGEGTSTLHGGKGDDYLGASNAASNILYGGKGDDILRDDFAPAHMHGGKDADTFLLLNLDPDVIYSFNVKQDRIGLNVEDFVGVQTGVLTDVQFLKGAVATTPEQRILYDANSGNALYDADGSGVIAPVVFAVLSPHLKMHAHNFVGILD